MGWVVSFMPQLCFFCGKRTTSIQSQSWRLGERKIPFPCHKLHPTSSSHGLVAVLTELFWLILFINMKPLHTQKLLSTPCISEHFKIQQIPLCSGLYWLGYVILFDSPVGPQDVQLQKVQLMMQIQYLMMFITNRLHDHQMMDKFDPKQ